MRVLTEELRLKAGVLRKFGQAYFGEEGADNDAMADLLERAADALEDASREPAQGMQSGLPL